MKTGKGDIKAQKQRYRERHPDLIKAQKQRYRERHLSESGKEKSRIVKLSLALWEELDWNKFSNYLSSEALKNKTRGKLAEELGISRDSVFAYLAGRRRPSYDVLHRLADLEGVEYDVFVNRFKR
jgi:ribosomal protein L20